MPIRAPRICSPCGLKIAAGEPCPCQRRREAARKARLDERRPSPGERGYDAAWRRCRADFIAKHPQCCAPGCIEATVEVDHIVSVADRPDLRLKWSNLRGMCKSHHSARTAREQGFARRTSPATHLPARAEPAPRTVQSPPRLTGGRGRGSAGSDGTARGCFAQDFPQSDIQESNDKPRNDR